jgi:hypothetical protein
VGEELDPTIETTDGDPSEDTPDSADGDTGSDTPTDTAPTDWESRYKELQANTDRRVAQVSSKERQLAAREQALKRVEPEAPPADDDLKTLPPHLRREVEEARAYREQAQWQEVKATYGEVVAAAYEAAFPSWPKDPAYVDAAIEFVRVLSAGAPKGQTAKPSRSEAVQPKVDANRSDAPDAADLDKKIETAKAGKGKDPLTSFISSSLKKRGLDY